MNFLTPIAFAGAALAIPIILLYMLRLRRREMVISSTFLWQQVLQDKEANTPWQRLRRNLLLFLQLLILALLIFTLARPFTLVSAVSSGRTILLLDASASMNATDINGDSRFDEAKRQALEIVDTLNDGNNMTVIRVAEVAEILANDTSNRGRLRDAINDAQVGISEADWDAALNLAIAGQASTDDFTIVIIGDGGLGETVGLPGIEGEIRYVPIGTSAQNIAISALATRTLPGQSPQLFAQITNYGDLEAQVVFSLRIDDELLTSENFTIPPNSSLPIVSTAELATTFSALEATLINSVNSESEDYLTLDNSAFAVSGQVSERRILVMTEGNLYLEQILSSLPGIEAVRGSIDSGLPAQQYDLYIFDGWLPETLPTGDMLLINPPRSTPLFTLGDYNTETTNPFVHPTDSRVAFVDFNEVSLLRFRDVFNVEWAESLITLDGGAVLMAGVIDGRQVALMPFDLRESDLPLNIAFPVLMANLTEWFTPTDALTANTSVTVGDTIAIRPPLDADTVQITLPDGDTQTLTVDRETLIFADTQQSGVYLLEAQSGSQITQQQPIVVNLFSPLESMIAPISEGNLQVGSEVVPIAEEEAKGQQEHWQIVALLVLLMLLIEWYVYHRRLHMPTLMRPLRTRNPFQRQRAT